MQIIYRISDNSYPKVKLPGATKKFCFKNCSELFTNIIVICDNCQESTIEMVKEFNPIVTNLSNAGSFQKAFEISLDFPDDEEIYYIEDDYLHFKKNLQETISEGLAISEYITLFDHPDKYQSEYNFGEPTIVHKTRSTHWRTTISTCMTFAGRVKYLREDQNIWRHFTAGQHPHDHQLFCALKDKQRKLLVSIPGLAFHTDLTYQFQKLPCDIDSMIEPWVIDMLAEAIGGKCEPNITGYRKLMLLDAYKKIQG